MKWNPLADTFRDVYFNVAKRLYEVKVSKVDIDPYPIVKGKPTTFSISASTGTFWSKKVRAD